MNERAKRARQFAEEQGMSPEELLGKLLDEAEMSGDGSASGVAESYSAPDEELLALVGKWNGMADKYREKIKSNHITKKERGKLVAFRRCARELINVFEGAE